VVIPEVQTCPEIVHESPNVHFSGQWIGRGGLKYWSSQSPDHTPLLSVMELHDWCQERKSLTWAM
jgi:hypothetical protein